MAAKVDAEEKSNTFDPTRVQRFVKDIERHHESLLSERMSYMARCRPIRENIGKVYELASEFGIPKKVLKAKIKERDLRRQIDGLPDDFEDDDRSTFEQVSQALGDFGDLPLGQAAKDRAAKADDAADNAAADATPKRGRGRPRKAPSPNAAPMAAADPREEPYDDVDNPIFKQGYQARQSGTGCSIPNELNGDDRDRWHAGWLAADSKTTGDANAERLAAGISPLH